MPTSKPSSRVHRALAWFAIFSLVTAGIIPQGAFPANADGPFDSGDGSVETPYQISTCLQLESISDYLSSHFELTADIDCGPDTAEPTGALWDSGRGFDPIGDIYNPFTGTFDGKGHTISNLFISRNSGGWSNAWYVGLFAVIGEGASVTDLSLTNVDISAQYNVGAFAGILTGTLQHVTSTGAVQGSSSVGGLVGAHTLTDSRRNSSPLVYTWDGSKYRFTDDVGALMPSETNGLDLAQIDNDALVPKDGAYSMHISEEYNEVVYYDELSLMTFDHVPGYSVVAPMTRSATTSTLRTVRNTPTNPLVRCTDFYGHDCLNDLRANDDQWAYKDRSLVNTWTLDFGDLSHVTGTISLMLRAARDYTATPDYKIRTVQLKDAGGAWKEIYNKNTLGSDGTPRLRVIDLTGKFMNADTRVKIGFDTTSVNYFAVDTSPQVPVTVNTYHPTTADLAFRGFTAATTTHFVDHDFDTLLPGPPEVFRNQFGNFTKYGDVTPLLNASDDHFVVMRYGDDMHITFPYEAPAEGMERSFIVNNNALYKHATHKQTDPYLGQTVDPLPYAGMTSYTASTTYPMTEENAEYLRTWNTRHYDGTLVSGPGSTIIDSYSSVDVTGTGRSIGGLVGDNKKLITGSHATGNVSGYYEVGGLAGYSNDNAIVDSSASGDVLGDWSTGGLVGYADSFVAISGSHATGRVSVRDANASPTDFGGLIGYLGNYSTTTDSYASGVVGIDGGNTNVERIGGLIGSTGDVYLEQVYATGAVSASSTSGQINQVGGLVGRVPNPSAVVSSTWAIGSVTGSSDSSYVQSLGGLIGESYGAVVSSTAYGSVVVSGVGSSNIGGLAGFSFGMIDRSQALNDTVEAPTAGSVGGLVGYSAGMEPAIVSNSYSTANVSGNASVGGLIGYTTGIVYDSYATGTVTGHASNVGGLIGETNNATVSSTYATGAVFSTGANVGGLIGYVYDGDVLDSYATGNVTSTVALGSYHLSQFADGRWQEKFVKNFPVHYKTEQFSFTPVDQRVSLRLVQKHIEFGDIDQVQLTACGSTVMPEFARYVDSLQDVRGDLSLIDNNVVTVHEQPIDISWRLPSSCHELATVSVTANEYGSAAPILFKGNYRMGSEMSYAPYWRPTTGHPDGYTYINLSTDHDALHISMDVTGDNTNDASGDWTSFIVGNKTFYLDDQHTEWGTCTFGLTDKVSYKHKQCTFSIPTSELPAGSFPFRIRYYGTLGTSGTGGLIGGLDTAVLSRSYAKGNVDAPYGYAVGGLVGYASDGQISDVYSTGDVTAGEGGFATGQAVGGLIGRTTFLSEGFVANAYASGTIAGVSYVGGLVGFNDGTPTSHSFAVGTVTSTSDGNGFVGMENGDAPATYTNNFWANDELEGIGGRSATSSGEWERVVSRRWFKGTSSRAPFADHWSFSGPSQVWVATAGCYPTLSSILADDPTSCDDEIYYSVQYNAGSGGSITGSTTQMIAFGESGSLVSATALSGYRFVRWSDGVTSASRTDADIMDAVVVSAIFELIPVSAPSGGGGGGAPYTAPPGVGSGLSDAGNNIHAGIGSTVSVGEVTGQGVNVLTYVTNRNTFVTPESTQRWANGSHAFQVTSLDLASETATIVFSSKPVTVSLKKGQQAPVDLDGDGVSDIQATFTNLYVNRIEVTLTSMVPRVTVAQVLPAPPVATSTQTVKYTFNKNLKLGDVHTDVKELQKYLNASGFRIAARGNGSPGKETTLFGPATRNALMKLQKAKKVKPANGVFGPLTRKAVNQK